MGTDVEPLRVGVPGNCHGFCCGRLSVDSPLRGSPDPFSDCCTRFSVRRQCSWPRPECGAGRESASFAVSGACVISYYPLHRFYIILLSLSVQFSVMDKSSLDSSVLAPPKATARCLLPCPLRLNLQLLGHWKTGGCLLAPHFLSSLGPITLHVTWNILRLAPLTSPGDFTYASRLSCILIASAKTEDHATVTKAPPLSVKLASIGFALLTCALRSPGNTATLANASFLPLFPCWAPKGFSPPDLLDIAARFSAPLL